MIQSSSIEKGASTGAHALAKRKKSRQKNESCVRSLQTDRQTDNTQTHLYAYDTRISPAELTLVAAPFPRSLRAPMPSSPAWHNQLKRVFLVAFDKQENPSCAGTFAYEDAP
jgi:hypothetical protein